MAPEAQPLGLARGMRQMRASSTLPGHEFSCTLSVGEAETANREPSWIASGRVCNRRSARLVVGRRALSEVRRSGRYAGGPGQLCRAGEREWCGALAGRTRSDRLGDQVLVVVIGWLTWITVPSGKPLAPPTSPPTALPAPSHPAPTPPPPPPRV